LISTASGSERRSDDALFVGATLATARGTDSTFLEIELLRNWSLDDANRSTNPAIQKTRRADDV